MNEKNYNKRLDFQQKMIAHQSEQIEDLKLQNAKLIQELIEKDEIINATSSLREEMAKSAKDVKKYKEEYRNLIEELRKMKKILNQDVYKGRWRLVKFLIK